MDGILTLHVAGTFLSTMATGVMVFFSLILAPALFRRLGRERAGDMLHHLFPLYHKTVAIMALLSALSLYVYRIEALFLATAAGLAILQLVLILPKTARLRLAAREDETARAAFGRLHGISMVVNLTSLLLLAGVSLRLLAA